MYAIEINNLGVTFDISLTIIKYVELEAESAVKKFCSVVSSCSKFAVVLALNFVYSVLFRSKLE